MPGGHGIFVLKTCGGFFIIDLYGGVVMEEARAIANLEFVTSDGGTGGPGD